MTGGYVFSQSMASLMPISPAAVMARVEGANGTKAHHRFRRGQEDLQDGGGVGHIVASVKHMKVVWNLGILWNIEVG